MNKKIVIIHPALAPYRVDFFNKLAELHDIHVIFLRENAYSFSFNQQLLRRKLNCSHEFLTEGLTYKSRIVYRKGLIKAIENSHPEIVVTHEYSPQTFQVLFYRILKQRFQHIIWSADNAKLVHNDGWFNQLRKKIALSFVDGISVYTEDVKDILCEKYNISPNRVGVFPNVQDEKNLRKELNQINEFSSDFLKSIADKNVILFVGRLAKVKNIPYLISAYQYARKNGLQAKLIIVGDGKLKKELKNRTQDLDNIYLVGSKEGQKLMEYYKVADLFVLPSYSETFGAVVNEALICGVPVMCSKKAGAKSLIKEGYNGCIFDPDDSYKKLGVMLVDFFNQDNKKILKQADSLMLKSFDDYVKGWLPENI